MKKQRGRPRTYKPEYCDKMFSLLKEGALDCEISAELGVSRDTFYRWLNEYPEFKSAHDIGLEHCEAWWTKGARQRYLAGDDKGFKYFISIMNNKFKWEKGTKSEGVTTNITIGNMNVLQQKSRDGLLEYINNTINKHKDVIDVELIENNNEESSE